ncbi:cytochrome P450 [Mycobacterium sp. CVI_P3]|uniref:Cytochrome P450 n=1 Tax=Mycobacterium pinniadriaticum TaxID=2994102 RepID=A0ABT3SF19_9MYCO|nr:cytochrome P450 [Mycobacterium pinniadriaticum]MCX2931814.1 cytochrome P450 [Mycobacterium pinniadriaticum]MCX2938111.1 cytochrome P450 [Mycobacterium pinniadriaticum]
MSTINHGAAVAELAANFDHWDPDQAACLPDTFRQLRDKCPVAHSDRHGGFWVLTRYDDVEEVLKNPGDFSSRYTSIPRGMFGEFTILPPIQLDPPAHAMFRKLLVKPFTAQNVQKWEDLVRLDCRAVISQFIDQGRVEVSSEYAKFIPLRLMATMLGISPDDEGRFASWIKRILEMGAVDPDGALAAAGEMQVYLAGSIADHRANPKDDVITLLIDSEVDGAKLNDEDLLGALFLLILAGMDTTWGMITAAIYHLSQHPEDRDRLAADPSLLPVAIEEFVRYFAPVHEGRSATRTVELNGVTIQKGDPILVCFGAANRDPAAFESPETVIIDRKANRHFGFGVGIHRCLGAHLARLEVRLALEEWLRAIPEFWLAEPEKVRWSTGQLWSPKDVVVGFPAGGTRGAE